VTPAFNKKKIVIQEGASSQSAACIRLLNLMCWTYIKGGKVLNILIAVFG